MLRYKCLVFDHDDTAVRSSPEINYPSFLETLAALRPDYRPSYAEFMDYCCEPGFPDYCTGVLGFSKEELELEYANWQRYTRERVPDFWEGVAETLASYERAGGRLCVVSHSSEYNIMRDYAARCPDAMPDLVFGWERGEGRIKPGTWPVLETLRELSLEPGDLLAADDMLTGLAMARASSIDFVCAGWSHVDAPELRERMRASGERYLETPGELLALLLSAD